jgi:hypothetical protein
MNQAIHHESESIQKQNKSILEAKNQGTKEHQKTKNQRTPVSVSLIICRCL